MCDLNKWFCGLKKEKEKNKHASAARIREKNSSAAWNMSLFPFVHLIKNQGHYSLCKGKDEKWNEVKEGLEKEERSCWKAPRVSFYTLFLYTWVWYCYWLVIVLIFLLRYC